MCVCVCKAYREYVNIRVIEWMRLVGADDDVQRAIILSRYTSTAQGILDDDDSIQS